MNKIDEQLKLQDKECKEKLLDAKNIMDKAIEPNVTQFQKNTHFDIAQQFGDFLYASLGDRVTGQRQSVLNETFFKETDTGKDIAKKAKEANQTIEEYVKESYLKLRNLPYWERRMRGGYSKQQIQLYITVGRRFGISYFTGNDGRTHTMYFGKGECLKYLTQSHVDCVKNRQKRECVQDFYNFKVDFLKALEAMSTRLIPVNQPVQIGIISLITKMKKFSIKPVYQRSSGEYTNLDSIEDLEVTHMGITTQQITPWDMKEKVSIYDVRDENAKSPAYISVFFFNVNDKKKDISIVCNLHMSVSEITHTLINATVQNTDSVISYIDCVPRNYTVHAGQEYLKNYIDSGYTMTEAGGVILNMDVLWKNPVVQAEVQTYIKFYNDMSQKLQELKHKHSTLYFLNGDL